MFQIFNVDKGTILTEWVRENGACMREITPEEERAGVAGMRRGATQEQIAEIYGVRLFSVQLAENKALGQLKRIIEEREKKSKIKLKQCY